MKNIGLDLETYSSVDLTKAGVYKYTEAPDFDILLFGYSVDGGPVQVVDLASGEKLPDEIIAALTDDAVTKWAFNAQFERICLSRWLRDHGGFDNTGYSIPQDTVGDYLDPAAWRCTMVWSATMGLPLSLEGVGAVLGLDKQKLTEGKELIKYFCQPCAPTKANGGRTRNLPSDAPEKWAAFKRYNKRDVEVEQAIQNRLHKYLVPESVWEEYHLDQEINDRGVRLDMTLVQQAIAMDARSRKELMAGMKRLTDLENPNSVVQMKQWLSDNGLEMDSLGKKEVAAVLKTAPPELQEVLLLRQQLAKSSVKKYQAMEKAVCADGRARGMFQFYGANRTGRWAGRIIQLQNLPQNHLPDLAEARALVRAGDYDAVKMLYEDVPDTLSQLIRTAFIARPGKTFYVSDFSAVEARVLAWFAGEQWRQEVFERGGDIYCASASAMFHCPVEKHGVNSHLRQKGKIAELACIAENELVLTDQGLIPIQDVTTDMKLWDGEEWVTHDGVIYKGEREVINYDGLTATADHLVFIDGQSEPVQFGVAAACRARLTQTGNGRRAVWLGEDHQPGEAVEQELESLLCSDSLHGLRLSPVAGFEQSDLRKVERLPELLPAEADTEMAGQASHGGKTALRESEGPEFSQLRCERDSVLLPECAGSGAVSDPYLRTPQQEHGDRPDRQQWPLCAGKHPVCDEGRESGQQADYRPGLFRSEILALCRDSDQEEALLRNDAGRDHLGSGDGSTGETEELAHHQRTARLYDIRNAGPRHRFTVSGRLVHNCGYGGSLGAMKAMGGLEMGLTEDELRSIVADWREANPNIVRFWWDIDRAAMSAVRDRIDSSVGDVHFAYRSGMLFVTLPSGRRLAYVKPKIGTNQFGGDCITYEGVGGTKKWERLETYGPKLTENIVQATSRDLLCFAMRTLSHCFITMHIHDELVIEADPCMSLEALCEQMGRTPPWAKGLKLQADGYTTEFYKKD